LYRFGNYYVWKLKLTHNVAKSIAINFSEFNLPLRSSAFIYNNETKFIVGPIGPKNIHNGKFNSDYIIGKDITIDIFIPESKIEEFKLLIPTFIQGISQLRNGEGIGFGASPECGVNSSCPEGEGWETQIESVCQVIYENVLCTGALVNNECFDLTPYVLTAGHCALDPSVIDEYIFRFNYISHVCTDLDGDTHGIEPHPSSWQTFSGAVRRASRAIGDFALLELNEQVTNSQSFSGWDRSGSVPSNATMIHHPLGDAKKITYEDGPLTAELAIFTFNLTPDANGDWGILNGGSSGAPQYNSDKRIVGHVNNGNPQSIQCDTPSSGNANGRFDIAWFGDGTPSTSLGPWLGNTDNPIQLNGIDLIPKVTGVDVLCSDDGAVYNFEVINLPPGFSASWEVMPSALFESATFGNGTLAILTPILDASGRAIIKFTLSGASGCSTPSYSKEIWIGKPDPPVIEIPDCFPQGTNVVLNIESGGAATYTWEFPNCPNGKPGETPDPECWFNYSGNSSADQILLYVGQQDGFITVNAQNECGISSTTIPINFCEDGGTECCKPDYRSVEQVTNSNIKIFPNPVTDKVNIAGLTYTSSIKLYNATGGGIRSFSSAGELLSISTDYLAPGLYFIQIIQNDQLTVKEFIKF